MTRDSGVDCAPISPFCGVPALPAGLSYVIDPDVVCDSEDCDAYEDGVAAS